ncbi:MAG: MFS transporter [Patescibacteria group bacterium]|nr:MFS transporter [Patescibacteria group bacterium]
MGYKEAVARNPRLLFWGKVFMEAKGLAIIEVLFFMHRGLTIDEVYYLSIAWSIATLITEVPSGYLADRIGRKRTIMIGMVLYLTACIIRIYAFGFFHFAVVFVLFSIGFSCMSGTEEALLFDSLKEVNKVHEMQKLNARLRSGKFVARICIAIVAIF